MNSINISDVPDLVQNETPLNLPGVNVFDASTIEKGTDIPWFLLEWIIVPVTVNIINAD